LGACATLVGVCNVFVGGLDSFLGPKAAHAFASQGVDALRHVLSTAAAVFIATLGAILLVFVISGDALAVFVYGGEYSGTGPILAVLALNILVNSMGVTAGNGLWAIDRPQANFAADACNLIVTLAVALCLVGPFGVLGGAIAMLVGTAVSAAVRLVTVGRYMRLVREAPAAS
jgi:O-antigen/teichoic acid export membrane protein